MHFTDAEVGLYMRLLCTQWNTGSIPDDDEELRTYSRGDTPLARVKAKFQKGTDGRLRNERLEKVRAERLAFIEKCSIAGKSGGRPGKGSERVPFPRKSSNDNGSGRLSEKGQKGTITSPSPISDLRSPSPTPISDLPSTPKPPTPFDRFWHAYPRKTAKADAERAWRKGKLDGKVEEILKAIATQAAGWEWQKDNGQFIPYPATWLNRQQWLDEVKPGFTNGTHSQNNRNGTRPTTGDEQRQLGIPEPTGPTLGELRRRKRQSPDTLATSPDRAGGNHAGSAGDGNGNGNVVPAGA